MSVIAIAASILLVFDLCEADWMYRYHTDPSGTFMKYDAKAIGSGSEAAQSELQDKWHKVRFLPSPNPPSLPLAYLLLCWVVANDTTRSSNPHSTRLETSHGGETRSS